MPSKAAFFLDRDGVINRTDVRDGKPYAPTRLADFELLPRVCEAVQSIKDRGYLVIVVTNQPDVGNGKVERRTVESMHARLRDRLAVDAIYACYHRQSDGCACRKPKPGMLLQAAADLGVDLRRSFMVGDRSGDIAAGQSAGCRTVFIDARYAEPPPANPDHVAADLFAAVNMTLVSGTQEREERCND